MCIGRATIHMTSPKHAHMSKAKDGQNDVHTKYTDTRTLRHTEKQILENRERERESPHTDSHTDSHRHTYYTHRYRHAHTNVHAVELFAKLFHRTLATKLYLALHLPIDVETAINNSLVVDLKLGGERLTSNMRMATHNAQLQQLWPSARLDDAFGISPDHLVFSATRTHQQPTQAGLAQRARTLAASGPPRSARRRRNSSATPLRRARIHAAQTEPHNTDYCSTLCPRAAHAHAHPQSASRPTARRRPNRPRSAGRDSESCRILCI